MSRSSVFLIGRLLALVLVLAMPFRSQAIEEPAYTVARVLGDGVELRRYAAYVVAEVTLPVEGSEAGSAAFPILAGYIFGKNRGEQRFAMTAPVTQTAAPVRMDMTAPVTQMPAPGGGTRVQFVLPRTVTLATAPQPIDPRVQLREEPQADWLVIRYSGTWSEANTAEHLARLKETGAAAGIRLRGEPVLARYDPPFKPWFMRRNEIWLAVEPD